MKLLKTFTTFFSVGILLISCSSTNAQHRTVVKTPNRTVVTTRTPGRLIVNTTPAPRVRVVATIPNNAVVITHGSIRNHYHAGVYYRYNSGRYIVVTPPLGIRINVLPIGYTQLFIGGITYYHYEGCYYIKTDHGQYETVKDPQAQDAVVFTLPEDTEEITIDGKVYHASNGTLYKVVVTPEGKGFKAVSIIEK
ncbi:hypothetical protein SAMN03097699_1787 [Flavobacteriaceae bacterium MAR_2010_188]|nr:hypothetical protein SAMN03097699_1787 [Flavobacteriaceae bacterium MAR_2010_188]